MTEELNGATFRRYREEVSKERNLDLVEDFSTAISRARQPVDGFIDGP